MTLYCVLRTTKGTAPSVSYKNKCVFSRGFQNLKNFGNPFEIWVVSLFSVKFGEFWVFRKIREITYQKYRDRDFWTHLFGKRVSKPPHPRPLVQGGVFRTLQSRAPPTMWRGLKRRTGYGTPDRKRSRSPAGTEVSNDDEQFDS